MSEPTELNSAPSEPVGDGTQPSSSCSDTDSPPAAADKDSDEPKGPVDDPKWTEGDVVLISSDGVRFRVQSYHVLSSSPVMRTMCQASDTTPKTLQFSNPEFETARTLRQYLFLVTEGLLNRVKEEDYLALLPITLFLREYECSILLSAFLLHIHKHLFKKTLKPICVFAIGAVANHETTMAQALANNASESPLPHAAFSAGPSNYIGGGGPKRTTGSISVFDTCHWSLALWRAIPTHVTWALAGAFAQTTGDPTDLPHKFILYLSFTRIGKMTYSERSNRHTRKGNLSFKKLRHSTDRSIWFRNDPDWSDGDFELISSDNVIFMVPSYHLLSHSGVFRNAQAINATEDGEPSKSLQFTDPDFETADTLQQFLCLITTGQPRQPLKLEAGTITWLVTFLRKYECTSNLATLLVYLRDQARESHLCPFLAFAAGAAADDPSTCEIALRMWKATAGEGASRRSVWEPHRIPHRDWLIIPSPYIWALCRAWGKAGKTANATLSIEFAAFIKEARAPPKPPTPPAPVAQT